MTKTSKAKRTLIAALAAVVLCCAITAPTTGWIAARPTETTEQRS